MMEIVKLLSFDSFCIIIISWIVFFLFGYYYFSILLFQDYEIKDIGIFCRFLFSFSFMFSFHIFLILLFELLNILKYEIRKLIWEIDFIFLFLFILLFIPLLLFYIIAKEKKYSKYQSILLTILLQFLFFYFFFIIGNYIPSNISLNNNNFLTLQNLINRVGFLGLNFIAILSGFGAVNMPYESMTIFWRPVNEENIFALERRLRQNIDMILIKKKRIIYENQNFYQNKRNSLNLFENLYNRFFIKNKKETYLNNLKKDVLLLENVAQELFLELYEIRELQKKAIEKRTLKGRFFNWIGYLFCIFCIYKMFISIINVIFQRDREKDPITNIMEKIIYFWPTLNSWINIHFISNLSSFIFIGILVFTQIRGFLILILKFFRFFSSSVSSNSVVLLLAHLMGMYFVSSFVMMRMNLQIENKRHLDAVLGNINYYGFASWFDIIFVLSSTCTIGLLILLNYSKLSRTSQDTIFEKYP